MQYLNPAIAACSTLFAELNRNTPTLTHFLAKTSHLVSDVAPRSSDLSGLVSAPVDDHRALAHQRVPLGQTPAQLPGFMRLANTTFVNLRTALDDLTPLVNASKPVAPKLQKLLVQLRPLADDSVPTLTTSPTSPRRAPTTTSPTLPASACPLARHRQQHQRERQGPPRRLPAVRHRAQRLHPELAAARPYAVDLTGWFEGYTHPGTIDANGSSSRVAPVVGVGSIENGTLNVLPSFATRPCARPGLRRAGNVTGTGATTPPTPRACSSPVRATRCPGSMERGAVVLPGKWLPMQPPRCRRANETGTAQRGRLVLAAAVVLRSILPPARPRAPPTAPSKIESEQRFGLVTRRRLRVSRPVSRGRTILASTLTEAAQRGGHVQVSRSGFGSSSIRTRAAGQFRPESR